MTRIFVLIPLLIFMINLIFAHPCVFAGVMLESPEKAAKGDAFVAIARSDLPVQEIVFQWLGKNYTVKTEKDGNGFYTAPILLPVPLDEKSTSLSLRARAGNDTKSYGKADISLYEKKRPVQKLQVDKKYVQPPASAQARIKADREKVNAALRQTLHERRWELPFEKPVPGSVSSLFGMKRVFNGEPRSVHKGLDLRGAKGTPIKACADGKVALVDNLYYSGNTVYLNHGDGVFSAYLHMSEPKVKPGQDIKKGDIIGLVGDTGRVTGPHLHLSFIVQGQSVDPEPLLEKASSGR